MPEGNNNIDAKQVAQQRNVANNANNVRAAAEIASKTNNPYAKAAGTAIKAADKISGGKASEKIGKSMDAFMKTQGLKGKMMQAALNKMSENGTSNRIAQATSKKNGNLSGASPKMRGVGGEMSQDTMTSVVDKNESESSDTATSTFSGSFKVVKYGLIGLAAIFPIIFVCLFIAAINVFQSSIPLGLADSLSGDEVEEMINKKLKDGDLDKEMEEKLNDTTAFSYDIYVSDNKSQILKNNKLYNNNIVQVTNIFTFFRRKYNEATLDRIEEFFPNIATESENYDKNLVYDFYFKMYNLYIAYKSHNVNLDLPLLMATLNLESNDREVVFSSNMDGRYRTDYERDIPKDELDYYYDWSDYKVSRDNSNHDMEILAQNMVSKQVKEKCVDSSGKQIKGKEKILKDNEIGTQTLFCDEGETYQTEDLGLVKDEKKYREFLKEFLEKKYFLDGESSLGQTDSEENLNTCSLIVLGDKYYKTRIPQTETCSVTGFYDNNYWGLEPTFYKNILALINDAKSVGCNAAIISGHRTYAKQSYLYDCYISGECNNGNLAAKPGYSNHEYGIAADLRYDPETPNCLSYYHTNAARYGLDFPLLYASFPEDWHIEPINIIKGSP